VVQLRLCEGMCDAAQEGGGDAEALEKLGARRSGRTLSRADHDRRLRRCWTEPFSTVEKAAEVRQVPVTLSHCGYVYSVVRCGERVCSAGGDGMIKVWSFGTLVLLANLTGHRGSVTCLANSQKSAYSRSLLPL
jgi:WD40 repeat protein